MPDPPWPSDDTALAAIFTAAATQFGAYTSLLWQVPVLSLTAQAFLLTIALDPSRARVARALTSLLSSLVASMSMYLMQSHRIHARDQGEVAARTADVLLHGRTDLGPAAEVWRHVNFGTYLLWQSCLAVFGLLSLGFFVILELNIRALLSWVGT